MLNTYDIYHAKVACEDQITPADYPLVCKHSKGYSSIPVCVCVSMPLICDSRN